MEKKPISISNKDLATLYHQLRTFLTNPFSQYLKFKFNQNTLALKAVVEPYQEAHLELFKKHGVPDDNGGYMVKEFLEDKSPNPKYAEFKAEEKPLNEEMNTYELFPIPSYLLKKLENDPNNYDLLYTHLIVEQEEEKAMKPV